MAKSDSMKGTIIKVFQVNAPPERVYRAFTDKREMEEWMADAVARRRLTLQLLAIFAGLALVLAAVGIYGTTSFAVTQQTRDIGVRRALGAQTGSVLWMVIAQGGRVVGAGIAAGILGALAITQLLKQSLFEVSAADPVTYIAVIAILAAAAVAASALPAWRASKVDPLVALRYE